MASKYGLDMDTSIVSDISALDCGDFDMIIEHLLCKPTKKSKRPKKTAHRKVHAAQSVPALNAHDLFNAPDNDEVDNSMANATFSAANTSYLSSFNDTCTTVNSEQFENIFAYFDQDVTTDDLLISEESDDNDDDDERHHIKMMLPPPPPPLNERENLASNLQNLLLTDKSKPKKKQTARQDIQNKSKAILSKIQQFNGIEPTNMSVVGRKPTSHRIPNRRPVRVLSTSSTASLHDSDSDTAATFKKPLSVPMNRGNVRSKVAFFNDHSSSERSSSTSPSVQSTSDDDEYQFKRTESKHKFKQNCNFFENFFKDKQHDQSILDTSTMRMAELQKQKREKKIIVENQKARNDVAKPKLDAHEKLRAVQTYVQTQYLLERIQRLVAAISSLDEKRLSSMNLRLLKKFLTFIRDCSYNCTEVCNTISQHVLTDFEKNVMSAEELLYTALKEAHSAQPPENELQKSHDTNTNISEHQLRVQASLQRLNIPDWFKQYNSTAAKGGESTGGYVPGSFTKKRNADVQRWTGLSSKTTSLSSLGSHRSDRSPLLLSPSAQSHHGHTGFSRWSTSHLNSSQTSPSASTRGSFSRGGPNASILSNQSSIRGSFRQPYLGWRSQEKLSQPRTPHERLASSMLSRQQTKQQQQQQQQTQSNNTNSLSAKTATEPAVSPEIQTSIKEVTSAIVHYVNDQTNRSGNSRSRSASPSSRRCWLESSFVGNKPMDSPQTPVLESSIGLSAASSRVNGVESPLPVLSIQNDRPSHRGSATLEDVLASLLGLPSEYRSSGDTNTINDSCRLTIDTQPLRRRSESDAAKRPDSTTPDNNDSPAQLRRVSLDSTESKSTAAGVSSANASTVGDMIKCRNPKCDATASPSDAKRNFKSCHNCTQIYCSRDCRRAHWEKHRKACLHSRVSVLCRQVLSACKDDNDTLSHLSILARRGYLTQGRGVVRILFRSPESAEVFVKQGFQRIGEASYVRWPELMPQEMGPELYSELLRLSTEYKPDSKMLIYVAICVVSEAPSSASSTSVKWERQLVSRCAKLKLSKTLPLELVGNYANSTANTGHQRTTSNTSNSASDPLASSTSIAVAEPIKVYTDVLILTFNMCDKTQNTLKNRELVLQNMQLALKKRGVSLRKHYPEIFQRLNSFVEGTTDRFMPVTLHPRDSSTGQPFICIMMPNLGETDRIKLPESDKSDKGNIVTIDCLEVDQSTLID